MFAMVLVCSLTIGGSHATDVYRACSETLFSAASVEACDDWMFGARLGPRWNSANGEAFEGADDLVCAFGWSLGVEGDFPICPIVRLLFGLAYTQRGYGWSNTVGSTESSGRTT
jgi:hypothetical protein